MLADGEIVGDGSWNLMVYVTDLNDKRTLVVKGDMHIGGVMLKLTELFDNDISIEKFKDLTDAYLKELCPHIGLRMTLKTHIHELLDSVADTEANDTIDITTDASSSKSNIVLEDPNSSLPCLGDITNFFEDLNRLPLPDFDVNTLLQTSAHGNSVLNYYKKFKMLNVKKRNILVDIVIKHLYTYIINNKLIPEDYNLIAAKIVTLFPSENIASYYMKAVSTSKSTTGKYIPARGKLVDKVRNLLYVSGERHRRPQSSGDDKEGEDGAILDLALDDDVLWLNTHSDPWDEVVEKWLKSLHYRVKLNSSAIATVDEVLQKWTILRNPKGHILINLDFDQIYKEKSLNFYKNWQGFFTKLSNKEIKNSTGLTLLETLGAITDEEFKKDWSDHALWWPTRNKWLSRPRQTLDQCGVHADACLHFTPMHKPLRIQLPDLRYIDCKIDFSIDTFSAVVQLCKSLGIRHPEELSLYYPLEQSHLKQNYQNLKEAKRLRSTAPADTNTFIAATRGSSNSLDRSNGCPATPPPPRSQSATPVASNGTLRRYGTHIYSTQSDGSSDGGYCGTPPRAASLDALDALADLSLADSPLEPDSHSRDSLLTPKTLVERARMNVGWLDSSLSVMEQHVREWDTLQLRFKFYSFFDLAARAQDAPRLNQLYQQARWQLLNQEVHCTEEEMLLFAALQLQIELQTLAGGSVDAADGHTSAGPDDIDAALSELETQLEGGPPARADILQVPELAGHLKYMRPKRFTLKAYKRGWVSCRDGTLRIHSSRDAAARGEPPAYCGELRGAEVTPDAHPASNRYSIKLEVPSEDAMNEIWLRCENEEQYAEWVAACRLGARGRSLADAGFAAEAGNVRALLRLQTPRPAAAAQHSVPHLEQLQPENYVAPRVLRRLKGKFTQRVLESHANVKDLPLLEAKLQYIKTWQNLPDYGQTLFVVRFMGHRKDEVISIANNRIMRLDPNTGDHLKTWRYSTMKAWNVNWEIKHMMVQFEEGNIIFSVQSADCKVVHEFIGGYIFLSMRSRDALQALDGELFHKLTGGWT